MPVLVKNFLTLEQVTRLQQALRENELPRVREREYIAHRLFKSVDDLKNLLDKLLNQGELVIKWFREIKKKVNNLHVST